MVEKRRTHIVLPKEMVDQIDSLVGKRGRSKFIEEALVLPLINAHQRKVFSEFTDFLDPADYPEWSTPEKISAWVRAQRQQVLKQDMEREARWAELRGE